ncbi:hypothetical protein [Shewanella surugensis]|uniref:Uncharacterized protein n=1 Tax=Shewanella surugensis TaxID=212020 RepID=A0ABT0LB34_9GAMM|nr:hypothetical protein [Shewanella surugensis]MCL1124850.1 hypothetical protein [Shewanella surugensis]
MLRMSDGEQNYLFKAFVLALFLSVLGFFFTFIYNIVLSRMLTPQSYGNFKTAESFVHLAQMIVLLGGNFATFSVLPKFMEQNIDFMVWRYLRFYMMIGIIVSMCLGGAVIIIEYNNTNGLKDVHPILFAIFAIFAIPFAATLRLLRDTALIKKRLIVAYIPKQLGYPLLILLVLIVLNSMNIKLTSNIAISVVVVSYILLTVIVFSVMNVRDHGEGKMSEKSLCFIDIG